jgi:penicillin amidase
VAVGGDSDTVQCSGYSWSGRKDFDVSSLSVYRQVVDFADVAKTTFVIPGGVWAMPGTEHYNDQLEHWRAHHRVPAYYTENDVESAAVHRLTLTPA